MEEEIDEQMHGFVSQLNHDYPVPDDDVGDVLTLPGHLVHEEDDDNLPVVATEDNQAEFEENPAGFEENQAGTDVTDTIIEEVCAGISIQAENGANEVRIEPSVEEERIEPSVEEEIKEDNEVEEVQMCFDVVVDANDSDPDEDENSESMNGEEHDSENDSTISDQEMDTDWTADAFDYQNVKVSFEDVAENLKHKLREGVDHLRKSMEDIWNAQSLSTENKSDVVNNFTAFANLEFWQHLVQFLNKNRNQNEEPVDAFDMSKFFRCI
jgi:hypothetical protein